MLYIKKEYSNRHVDKKVGFVVSVNFSLHFFNCICKRIFIANKLKF